VSEDIFNHGGEASRSLSNTGIPENATAPVSCRVANSILNYLEMRGYNPATITGSLPVSTEYLTNSLNWITGDLRDTLADRTAALLHDEKVMYHIGLDSVRLAPINGVVNLVRFLGNPEMAYKKVPQYTSMFDKAAEFAVEIRGEGRATVTYSLQPGERPSKHACYYTQGVLAAIPMVWGLPPAEVREIQCMFDQGKGTAKTARTNRPQCTYEVTWAAPAKRLGSFTNWLFHHNLDTSKTLHKMEESFHELDEKNTELSERNTQLSITREIALGIDNVRTVDQVLELVVEKARDIPGIRFAMVLAINEQNGTINIPYYSKLRGPLAKELQVLGFNTETYLGKNPSNQTLVFHLDKVEAAREMKQKPRVIVRERLYDFSGEMVPRMICDTIQSALKIKKIVLVPIMIDGKLWAGMMFLLQKEVPTNILEMLGAHCAAAVNNVLQAESLGRRNRELSAINTITTRISFQQGQEAQLQGAIEEILKIFTAEAASVHLVSRDGKYLELAAQQGMPGPMLEIARRFMVGTSEAGRFLTSHELISRGDMRRFIVGNPEFKGLSGWVSPVHYISTRIEAEGKTRGLLTLVRYRDDSFDNADTSLLITVAGQIGICLENSRLQEEKFASDTRLKTVFQSLNDGIVVCDLQSACLDANDAMAHLFGFQNKAEIIGLKLNQVVLDMDYQRISEIMKRLLEIGTSETTEVRFVRKDGSVFYGEISGALLRDTSDRPSGIVGTIRDITERKQAEAALRQNEAELRIQKELTDRSLNVIPNSIVVIDRDMHILLANKAFEQNLASGRSIKGNPITGKLVPAGVLEMIKNVAAGKSKEEKIEYRTETNDGDKTLFAIVLSIGEGQVLLTITDLTREREQETKMYMTERLASVGEMASGIAHELNNPLTSVIGLSALLAEENLPANLNEDVQVICQEARRASQIVKSLLSFARQHEPKRQPTQIGDIVKDVLKLRAYEQKANNISVVTSISSDLPEIMVDYFQLQQVFLNIILNAEQAMHEAHGKGRLLISTEHRGDAIRISFSDDGPGIRRADLKHIFDPFFTTKEVGKGTGLGLSITYGIINSHGGKIWAESELGEGSTFIIELPIASKNNNGSVNSDGEKRT
jgi:PAS domain S-box-containing protein